MPLARFWGSTIGKKTVMAVTGIVLVGYVLAHVTANLLIFAGPAAIDGYAAKLRAFPMLLWGVRVLLLVSLVLHVVAAVQLGARSRAARPTPYHRFAPQVSSAASRTMRWGGIALLLFVVYHILHFTTGQAHPDFRHLAPYHNVTTAFQTWWVVAIYGAALVALALGALLWDKCGMARNASGLREALQRIPEIRAEFWENVNVPGSDTTLNQALEKAGRVADYLEFADLMCLDALRREESCGGHFREEHQTADGEAKRDDQRFAYVAAWEYAGDGSQPVLHREPLAFENVQLAQRSYR